MNNFLKSKERIGAINNLVGFILVSSFMQALCFGIRLIGHFFTGQMTADWNGLMSFKFVLDVGTFLLAAEAETKV